MPPSEKKNTDENTSNNFTWLILVIKKEERGLPLESLITPHNVENPPLMSKTMHY